MRGKCNTEEASVGKGQKGRQNPLPNKGGRKGINLFFFQFGGRQLLRRLVEGTGAGRQTFCGRGSRRSGTKCYSPDGYICTLNHLMRCLCDTQGRVPFWSSMHSPDEDTQDKLNRPSHSQNRHSVKATLQVRGVFSTRSEHTVGTHLSPNLCPIGLKLGLKLLPLQPVAVTAWPRWQAGKCDGTGSQYLGK